MKKLRNWPKPSPANTSTTGCNPFSGAGKPNCPPPPTPPLPLPAKSSSGCGGRPIWSMSSPMEVLPDSPSPICSSPITNFSSEFFTPKHQNGLSGTNTSVADKTRLVSLLDCDSNFNFSTENWKQEWISPARRSMSTLYESIFTTMDLQDTKGNPRKSQKHHFQEHIYQGSSSHDTSTQQEFCPLTRPRPYQEFLDAVQTQHHGAEIEAWKKAKQLRLQNKLRQREAEITNWEIKQKNKARAEMEAIERLIEIKRAKALKKMQQKIVQANKAAEKQRAHERRAALKKMAGVARLSEKVEATELMTCIKLQKPC